MNNIFTPKFDLLPKELREEIINTAREKGAYKASIDWFKRAGMSQGGMYERLKSEMRKESANSQANVWGSQFLPTNIRVKEIGKNGEGKERILTKEEKEFLRKLGSGEISYDETARFVAVRVFTRMLKNPDKWQYLDFFRTELIKVKREEAQIQDAWAKEIIGRMFAGKLPPKTCPECGANMLYEAPVTEGEIVNEQRNLKSGL